MQIKEEKKLENATIEMVIEVPQSRIDVEYRSVFDKIAKNAKVDGFRRGKAPMKLLENLYGKQAESEALENLLKSTFIDAVQEKSHSPVGEPFFDFKEFDRTKPFTYTVKFEIMPTLELGPYKEVEASERVWEVRDEDIDKEIDDLREKNAKISKKNEDAVVEKGDILRFGLKRIDNITQEEAEALAFKEYSIIVGKSTSEFALDKYLQGIKAGETKEIEVAYPGDYEVKDLASKKARYLVRVEEISKMELPAADDELAKDVSDFQTIGDLRQNIRETLEKYSADIARSEATDAILEKIIEKSSFDIPGSLIQKEMATIFQRLVERTGLQAKNPDEFAEMMGMEPEQLKGRIREEALNDIKAFMVRLEIAKKENISFSAEEFESMVELIAARSGKSVGQMMQAFEGTSIRENIETELIMINARKYIYDNAKIKKLKPLPFGEFSKQKRQ